MKRWTAPGHGPGALPVPPAEDPFGTGPAGGRGCGAGCHRNHAVTAPLQAYQEFMS